MAALIDNSEQGLQAVSTDFGGIFYAQPKGCATPKNVAELVHIVQYCSNTQTPIIARGMAHTTCGQSLSPSGIVVDMKQMNQIHTIEFDGARGFIKVDAGITWETIIKACLSYNATPPVLLDWQKLTVGGTLSTGGVSFMSHLNSIQADSVLELEVITGKGELLVCSRTQNKELFQLVRGGLGQYGIIATATIRLQKAPSKLHIHKTLLQETTAFCQATDAIRGQQTFECIHSFLIPHQEATFIKQFGVAHYHNNKTTFEQHCPPKGFSYFVEVAQYEYENQDFVRHNFVDNPFSLYEQIDYFEYFTKEPPLIVTQKEQGQNPHSKLALFIPVRQMEAFMSYLLPVHKAEDMADGPVLITPMVASIIEESAFVTPKDDFYFIGILRNVLPNTPEHIAHLTALNEAIYAHALSLGGKRYPCDSLTLPHSQEEWQAHFGQQWNFVCQGKQNYDPQHLFQSLLTIHNTPSNHARTK